VADLLDRVLGYLEPQESHLSVGHNVIVAALRERQRGRLTRAQIKTALALTDADDTGLNTVYQNIYGGSPIYTIEFLTDLLILGSTRNRADSGGAAYYTKTKVKTDLGL
jgi:hypothetical protein